jgi:long-chain fatty acid transport protein
VFAAVMFLAPATATADSFFHYGFTPRAIGMGNAFAATADDWGAAYYNPGGVGFQHRPSLGVGYVANFGAVSAVGVDDLALDDARAMIFGAVLPLPFEGGFMKDRIAIGVGGYAPEGRLLQMNVEAPSTPNLLLLRNAHRTNAMYPSLGIRITDGFAIGVGVQTFMDTIGEINAKVDPSGELVTEVGEELLITYTPTAGLLVRPGEHWDAMAGWRFGFVFRDETFTRYSIPVSAVLDQIPFIIRFDAISLFTPRQYLAAIAYGRDDWRVEFDLSFNEWSRFPDPNLLIQVDVAIPIAPIEFENSIGHQPHFHDTLTPRVGAEVTVLSATDANLLVRAGYFYDQSPVPPQTGYTNYVDTDKHAGSAAFGVNWLGVGNFRFDAPINIDVFYQGQYLPRRVHNKNDTVAPDNPGYPKVGAEGSVHFLGMSLSTYFDYE